MSAASLKLGKTRCYWVLLSPELDFLVTDPVLTTHLADQHELFIGRNVLEFVHPDEKASASHDLRTVLETRTLHGSVTRVRYSRVGRIRKQLGFNGQIEHYPGQEKVIFDQDYLACDIVINWAADGLVLCFMHAVVDISPDDNNESDRTAWTNWCGTPSMNGEQTTPLYHHLISTAPPRTGPPSRVFQILSNIPERTLLFTWPCDGYVVEEFARLASGVQIGGKSGSDAKTSCTRRYKALQPLPNNKGDVESIFIPYGAIIFACHKTVSPPTRPPSQQHYHYSAQPYHEQSAAPHAHHGHPPAHYPGYPPPQDHYVGSNTMYDRNVPYDGYPPTAGTWPHPPHPGASTPSPTSSTQRNGYGWGGSPYMDHAHPPNMHPHPSGPHNPSSLPPLPPAPRQHPPPSTYDTSHAFSHPSSYEDNHRLHEVPPPPKTRQRVSLGPEDEHTRLSPASASSREGLAAPLPSGGAQSGRSGGLPPLGVQKCASCKITSSPEWRKGPSGKKDLCNACGLRYARSRAKKEGVTVQRRRKDPTNASNGKSNTSKVVGGAGTKRSHEEAEAQELAVDAQINAHGSGRSIANLTPSPSPPSHGDPNTGYGHQGHVEYSTSRGDNYENGGYRTYPPGDPRYPESGPDPQYAGNGNGHRYPPEDHYPHHRPPPHGDTHQRPPLYPVGPTTGPPQSDRYPSNPAFSSRVSPTMHSSSIPISHHQALSFDRSADRSTSGADGSTSDILPPTPVSAPARHPTTREATFAGH